MLLSGCGRTNADKANIIRWFNGISIKYEYLSNKNNLLLLSGESDLGTLRDP